MRTSVLTVGSIALVCLTGGPAHAEMKYALPESWLSIGTNLGSVHRWASADQPGQNGFLWGFEGSYARSGRWGGWGGGYVDVLHDTATHRARLSLGPELGYYVFGIDGGYLVDIGQGRVRHGFAVRPFLSLAFLIPYGRVGWSAGADGGEFTEVGVLVKFPLEAPF